MTPFVERARAKVNLTLRIAGKRADGYHALESLVAFADQPVDTVTLDVSRPEGVTVTGPGAGAILGENLIARALRVVSEAESGLRLGHVTLDKHLPVAAGVGGGSADAAAVLRAVSRANPELASRIDWGRIALQLGADVPVCVNSEAAFMWGIGERIAHLPSLPRLAAVIVNPLVPVPADKTAQVFRKLGAARLTDDAAPDPMPPGPFADAAELLAYMLANGNDLEAPALGVVPAIADVKAALARSQGCVLAQLSGGGPTCFGVFENAGAAEGAAEALRAARPGWWVTATSLG